MNTIANIARRKRQLHNKTFNFPTDTFRGIFYYLSIYENLYRVSFIFSLKTNPAFNKGCVVKENNYMKNQEANELKLAGRIVNKYETKDFVKLGIATSVTVRGERSTNYPRCVDGRFGYHIRTYELIPQFQKTQGHIPHAADRGRYP